MKKKKKTGFTFVPNAIVDYSSGPSVRQETLNRIAALGIPLRYLKLIANEFGTYVEVKLLPTKKKRA